MDAGLVSSEQLVSFCHTLATAGEEIWGLNAFSKIAPLDELLDQARASDERRAHRKHFSLLDGIPLSVKSNIAVASEPLTAGSRILGEGRQDSPPCGYDSDVVAILTRVNGSILIGKTTMDEFGMGSLGTNVILSREGSTSCHTRNPLRFLQRLDLGPHPISSLNHDAVVAKMIQMPTDDILRAHAAAYREDFETHSAGGSSCGSAASVAHGSSLLSLGTDTGGSVRLPAAFCSIVGLKPSYGVLSRHGIVSYASSFDTVGILAPTIDCASIALDKLVQRGSTRNRDSTASFHDESLPALDIHNRSHDLSDVKVGIPSAMSVQECPVSIKAAWSRAAQWLAENGATVESVSKNAISPSLVQQSLAAYYVLVSAEASSNLSRYDGFKYGVQSDNGNSLLCDEIDLTLLEHQFSSTRIQGFGVDVARRVLCGTSVLSSDRFHSHYELAARLRASLAKELTSALATNVDVLLFPTALSLPWSIEADSVDITQMFANDVMTVSPSLAGLPSVSVPVAISENDTFTPGIQVVGPRLREDSIIRVGRVLASLTSN